MIQNRPYNAAWIVLGVLVLILLAFFFYSQNSYKSPTTQNTSTTTTMTVYGQKYTAAQALQNSGDYEKALDAFNNLLKSAPDKASEGKLKIFIAANLFARNQGDDQSKGIQTYKEVLNDPQMPAYVRAKVITDLAGIVNTHDESFYTTYFSEEPFRDFLPSSGTSSSKTSTAYLRMLQFSDAISPNSYAEYLIAGNYYSPRLVNRTLGTTTPEQAATIMQAYIKKADTLSPADESSYKPSVILERYFYRALALNGSNRVLKNVSAVDRENAFKLVLDKGAAYEHSQDYPAITIIMRARFYYANFLAEAFGAARNADIVTLLLPFGNAASGADPAYKLLRRYYAYLASAPDNDFAKTRFIAIAQISPELKSFLISIGLKP